MALLASAAPARANALALASDNGMAVMAQRQTSDSPPRTRRMGAVVAVAALAGTGAVMASRARPAAPVPGDRRETVFLVHGMGRTPVSMLLLRRRLERDGYRVVNWGYWRSTGSVRELAARLGREVEAQRGDAAAIHFVGHSLGNIIVRCLLAHEEPGPVGRIVMLAPPNQGSAKADRYASLVGWLLPMIHELRTDPASTARTLMLPDSVDVGIIAGTLDGKVRVAETHLDGARDHVTVRSAHSFIMNRGDVHRLIVRFLRDGEFAVRTDPPVIR